MEVQSLRCNANEKASGANVSGAFFFAAVLRDRTQKYNVVKRRLKTNSAFSAGYRLVALLLFRLQEPVVKIVQMIDEKGAERRH